MTTPFTNLAETAINRVLSLDPDTRARLGELSNKVIRLRLGNVEPIELFVLPSAAGVRFCEAHEHPPDVTLSGAVPLFARLALRRFVPEMVAAGELQISGDIDLGRRFQHILERIDVDWEEPAARVVGDVAAHQFGNVLRGMGRWSRHALQSLGQDAAEYLQEESRLLPLRPRAAAFRLAVESVREETEKLEARIARLHEKVK
ncbi:MAG TPA: SCP2 sterol-binding domain-containing protein [Candidatus Methylomirabilis sp.]|nr:SCP2 sterol-binding domain-containing protein [Candidatus Methylomirabilis sp.]